jgi:hypothetical protein
MSPAYQGNSQPDVLLAPGHGRRPDGRLDNGATTPDGRHEQGEGNRILTLVERRLIDVYGLTVVRQPQGGPNFDGTITDINRLKPRLWLEAHHDWIGAPRGGFGFHRNQTVAHPLQSRQQLKLCQALEQAYRREGLPTRGHMVFLPTTNPPVRPAIITRTSVPLGTLWEIDRIGEAGATHAKAIADGIAGALGAVPVQSDGRYTVKRGDTLSAIAKAHGVTVQALVAANGIANPNLIHPGQQLTIPPKTPTPTPTPAPRPVEPWRGKQVRAKADVRFYDRPGWHPTNPTAGIIKAGHRFGGGIHELRTVGGGRQYLASNSAGRRVWVTANPRYVELVNSR